MKSLGDALLENDPLVGLIQEINFVGWVYNIDYDKALVMTNDLWKIKALAIPHNCFLIAASFNPSKFSETAEEEREVILLRVIGSARLPQDDQLVKAKIDRFQSRTHKYESANSSTDYDDITLNQIQFHGLECRVLGTFYKRDEQLWLGSDLESFVSATSFNVYRPRKDTLETIVNYVDPIRIQKAKEDMLDLGIQSSIPAFPIGTVRYTSTDRLHRQSEEEKVKVSIQPTDFLGRRTAVLGMTRTGKSNMVKQTVAVVKRIARQGDIKIGQIIYDINGEYANANQQDKGAIADVYPEETVRYRMLPAEGFEELRNNFYEQLQEGFSIIVRELKNANRINNDYIRVFANLSLDEPDPQEHGEYNRYQRLVAAYRVLLYKAGFEPPDGYTVKFSANANVRNLITQQTNTTLPDPKNGLTLAQAVEWFMAAREANRDTPLPGSSQGSLWADETLQTLLDMIAQRGQSNNFISGFKILADALKYHSPGRTSDVAEEIYRHLEQGKIVILDLSVGDPTIRESLSEVIASKIFNRINAKIYRWRNLT